MTSRHISRVTSRNYSKIDSDARTAFPDDTDYRIAYGGFVQVYGGAFEGIYRIVKVSDKPRWIGDNGYTFERDLNAVDTLVMNERYSAEDYAAATDDHDARETHFARLAEMIRLNSAPIDQPKPTTRDELRPMPAGTIIIDSGEDLERLAEEVAEADRAAIEAAEAPKMTANEIAADYDSIFAACSAEDELNNVAAGIDFAPMSGALVATLTAAVDTRRGEIRIATAPAASFVFRCQYCGEVIVAETEIDSYFCEVARRLIEVALIRRPEGDYADEANAVATYYDAAFAAASTEAELNDAAANGPRIPTSAFPYIDASFENALTRIRRDDGSAAKMTADRNRVIDRSLETGRKYTDEQVGDYPLLRAVALDYVKTYRGDNTFVQNIAVNLVDFGSLSDRQLRGALNVMVAEARFERAEAKADALTFDRDHGDGSSSAIQDFYLDLRRQTDKDIEAAGEAMPPAAEAANEVEPAIPNGYYTVIIDPISRAYRTLRVGDCPAHFTVKPGTQLVSYLSGADNTSDYTGFAFLAGRRVSIWSKFRSADALRQAANLLVADPMSGAAEYVKRSNRCFVCNRPLTVEKSIDMGIGPICAEKIGAMGFKLLIGTRDAAVEENTMRDRLARQLSPAEAALQRARQRQAARGTITASQSQAEIDELFPE